MELIFKLEGLESHNWFEELNKSLATRPDRTIRILKVQPPPGTLGAFWTPTMKAYLTTAAEVATILSLLATLYQGSSDTCKFQLTDGSKHVEILLPCKATPPADLVSSVTNALAKLQGKPTTIAVTPQKPQTRKH